MSTRCRAISATVNSPKVPEVSGTYAPPSISSSCPWRPAIASHTATEFVITRSAWAWASAWASACVVDPASMNRLIPGFTSAIACRAIACFCRRRDCARSA